MSARRWLWPRRWWGKVLVVLVGLAVLARVTLPWTLPPVLNAVAHEFGLEAEYDGLELSLTGLRGSLRGLEVRALPDGDEPGGQGAQVLRLDYAGFDVAFLRLLRGDFVVNLLEVDGLEAWLERLEDDSWSIERHLPKFAAGDAEPQDRTTNVTLDRFAELDLRLPLEVRVARLQAVRVNVRDAAQDVDTHLDLDLTATDLGHPVRPARLGLRAGSPELLGALWCDGSLASGDRSLSAEWDVRLERLEAATILDWVSPDTELPFRVVDLTTRGSLKLTPQGGDGSRAARADLGVGHWTLDLDRQRTVDAHLDVTEVVIDPAGGVPSAVIVGNVALPGMIERLGVSGSFSPDPRHPRAEFALDAEQVTLTRIAGWLAEQGLAPEFSDGGAHAGGHLLAEATRDDEGAWDAHASVTDVFLERGPAAADAVSPPNAADPDAADPDVETPPDGAPVRRGVPLLALEAFELEGLHLSADGSLLRVERIELRGPELDLRRDPRGNWHALGLRTVSAAVRAGAALDADADADAEAGADDRPVPDGEPAAPAGEDADARVADANTDTNEDEDPVADEDPFEGRPRFELGLLRLEAPRVRLRDEARERPLDLLLGEGRLELTELALEPDPDQPDPAPAHLELTASIPALVEAITVQGEVSVGSALRRLGVELELGGQGLAGETVQRELEALGIESTHPGGGDLAGHLALRAEDRDGLLRADLDVSGLSLTQPGDDGTPLEWLGLDRFEVRDARVEGSVPMIESVTVDGARVRARREADGRLVAGGLRFPAPGPPAADPAAGSGAAPLLLDDDPPEARLPELPPAVLTSLSVSGVELDWTDADPPTGPTGGGDATVHVPLSLALEARDIDTRAARRTWTIHAEARSPGLLEAATAELVAHRERDSVDVDLDFEVTGLRDGSWSAYLPPDLTLGTEAGHLSGHLDALAAHHAEGGMSLELGVVDLRWTDGEDELLAVPAARLAVARVDPPAGRYLLDQVSLEGLALRTRHRPDGVLDVAGWRVGDAARRSRRPEAPPEVGTGEGARHFDPPVVRLERLDLSATALSYRDEREDGAPLAVAGGLRAEGPLELLGPDVNSLAPLRLVGELRGADGVRTDRLLEVARVEVEVQPLRDPVDLHVGFDLKGLNGGAVERGVPAVPDEVSLEGIREGRLTGALDVVLNVRRRTPIDLDLRRGVSGSFEVSEVVWTPDATAPPAFQLANLRAQFRQFVPGGARAHLSELQIEGVRGSAQRRADGLEALGVRVALPGLGAPPAGSETAVVPAPAGAARPGAGPGPVAGAPAPDGRDPRPAGPVPVAPGVGRAPGPLVSGEVAAPAEPQDPTADAPVPAGPPASSPPTVSSRGARTAAAPFELRIDRFGLRDVAWDLWDHTHEPATHVPLEDLEVDLLGFSTTDRGRPFRLRVTAFAGDVELPERVLADNALEGFVGATAGVLGGRKDQHVLEQRRWMDHFELTANVTLGRRPVGRAQMELRGLELTAFRGHAREAGVVVGDGVLDTDLELVFDPEGVTHIDLVPTFSYLSLSEPPNGPISRYLALPAPLDTVLFLLKDDEGHQVLPIRTTVDSDGLGSGKATAAVTEAVASLIASAVASAPMRIGGTALDLADGIMSKPLGMVDDVLGGLPGASLLGLGKEALRTELDLDYEPASNLPLAVGVEDLRALARAARKGRVLELTSELSAGDIEAAQRLGNPPRDELLFLAAQLVARRSRLLQDRAPAELDATRAWVDGTGEDAVRAAGHLRELDEGLATVERALDAVWDLLRPGAERRADARTRQAAAAIASERMRALRSALVTLGAPEERVRVRPARPVAVEGLELGRVRVRPPGTRDPAQAPPTEGSAEGTTDGTAEGAAPDGASLDGPDADVPDGDGGADRATGGTGGGASEDADAGSSAAPGPASGPGSGPQPDPTSEATGEPDDGSAGESAADDAGGH